MTYPRENTIQVAAAGSATDTVVTIKLPNASTGSLPAGQTGAINPIGASSRWRIRSLIASFSTTPTTPAEVTITDGTCIWIVDVTGPLVLDHLDLQCAGGAEVDITLTAVPVAVGHLNLSVVSEG